MKMKMFVLLIILTCLIGLSKQDLEYVDLNSFIGANLNYCKDLSYTLSIKLPPITLKFGKFCNVDIRELNSDKVLNSVFAYQGKSKTDIGTFVNKWSSILSKNSQVNLTESEHTMLLDSFKKIDIGSINNLNWIFFISYENEITILQKDSTIEIFDSICNSCKSYLFTGFNIFYNKLK
jgi:hypothetical protein